jgi:Pyruvate/2-oxoacid:ferredoxin oxidoreductase delta subunit
MGATLEGMVERGEIFGVGPMEARQYHLAPFVVGIWEFQLQRLDREFAELMEEYRSQGFYQGIAEKTPAYFNTIPINQAVDAQLEVYPYESVQKLMDKANAFIARECICRKEQGLLENSCGKPTLNCISMSISEDAFQVEYGGGRMVSREKAERMMKEAADAGLVHATMNITDDTYHFCNCCSCCCGLLRGVKDFDVPGMLARSNYWASIDSDACAACGTCADERCPMGAVSEQEDSYQVDRDRCIGCGVCVPTCPTASISLLRKPEDQCIQPPPNIVHWMMERSANTGKPLDPFL